MSSITHAILVWDTNADVLNIINYHVKRCTDSYQGFGLVTILNSKDFSFYGLIGAGGSKPFVLPTAAAAFSNINTERLVDAVHTGLRMLDSLQELPNAYLLVIPEEGPPIFKNWRNK